MWLNLLSTAQVVGSIGAFFKTNAYEIGGDLFSLDDIEHGVLRGNQVMIAVSCSGVDHCVSYFCPALPCAVQR